MENFPRADFLEREKEKWVLLRSGLILVKDELLFFLFHVGIEEQWEVIERVAIGEELVLGVVRLRK